MPCIKRDCLSALSLILCRTFSIFSFFLVTCYSVVDVYKKTTDWSSCMLGSNIEEMKCISVYYATAMEIAALLLIYGLYVFV